MTVGGAGHSGATGRSRQGRVGCRCATTGNSPRSVDETEWGSSVTMWRTNENPSPNSPASTEAGLPENCYRMANSVTGLSFTTALPLTADVSQRRLMFLVSRAKLHWKVTSPIYAATDATKPLAIHKPFFVAIKARLRAHGPGDPTGTRANITSLLSSPFAPRAFIVHHRVRPPWFI